MLRLFSGWLPVEIQQVIRADPSNYGVVHPYIGNLHRPNNALVRSGKGLLCASTIRMAMVFVIPGRGRQELKSLRWVTPVTFGQGVEDEQAWPAILARAFPSKRLINLGLIGGWPATVSSSL